jgi:hypothetical protein
LGFILRWRRSPKEQYESFVKSRTARREKLQLICEDRPPPELQLNTNSDRTKIERFIMASLDSL